MFLNYTIYDNNISPCHEMPVPKIDCILCSQKWRSSIWSAKTRPGADCGSDRELLIAKFRLKLEKVRKTTRPFRSDLNQIPYTGEVMNTAEVIIQQR